MWRRLAYARTLSDAWLASAGGCHPSSSQAPVYAHAREHGDDSESTPTGSTPALHRVYAQVHASWLASATDWQTASDNVAKYAAK